LKIDRYIRIMKIIAKNKDYYDGLVHTLGIDSDIIYTRKECQNISVYLNNINFPNDIYINNNNSGSFYIIGFAGKVYPAIRLERKNLTTNVIEYEWIYDQSTISELFTCQKIYKWRYLNNKQNVETFDLFIKQLNNTSITTLFHEHQVGSFILCNNISSIKHNLSLEPLLKDIDFYKCVDPFAAFLQMQTFISEQLRPIMSEVQLTDKEKVVAKGFDPKYGFRKRK